MYIPEKGDIVFVNFSPHAGHEQGGNRPAIILTEREFNRRTHLTVACPITSQIKGYPFEIKIPESMKIKGTILTDHIKSIDWRARDIRKVEKSPKGLVEDCLNKINIFLK